MDTNPDVLWGIPCFAGTRVPAVTLFDYLADGSTVDQFLDDFPSVPRETALLVLQETLNPA